MSTDMNTERPDRVETVTEETAGVREGVCSVEALQAAVNMYRDVGIEVRPSAMGTAARLYLCGRQEINRVVLPYDPYRKGDRDRKYRWRPGEVVLTLNRGSRFSNVANRRYWSLHSLGIAQVRDKYLGGWGATGYYTMLNGGDTDRWSPYMEPGVDVLSEAGNFCVEAGCAGWRRDAEQVVGAIIPWDLD